jgi:hypothetical protein
MPVKQGPPSLVASTLCPPAAPVQQALGKAPAIMRPMPGTAVAVVNALVFVSDHGSGMIEVVKMDLCMRDSIHQNRRVNRAPMIRSLARNPPRVHRAGAEVPKITNL